MSREPLPKFLERALKQANARLAKANRNYKAAEKERSMALNNKAKAVADISNWYAKREGRR